MPLDQFTCIKQIVHQCTLAGNGQKEVIERVFIPNHQVHKYRLPASLFNFDEL